MPHCTLWACLGLLVWGWLPPRVLVGSIVEAVVLSGAAE